MPASTWPTDRRSLVEVAAVVVTGVLHLFFEEVLHQKVAFIAIALLGWGGYFALRIRSSRDVLDDWGMRVGGLWADSIWPAAVLLVGAVLLAVAGAVRGHLGFHPHMLYVAAIYPVWGIAQQFMLQAMVVRNLRGRAGPAWVVVLIAAALFALVHWPDAFLMVGTALLALVFTPLYLWRRSILPLGVCHGWLGVLAYYWLLGRDSWAELTG